MEKYRILVLSGICILIQIGAFTTAEKDFSSIFEGDSVVIEGAPIEIVCKYTVFDQLHWQKDGQTINQNEMLKIDVETLKNNSGFQSKLTIYSSELSDSGEYKCGTFHDTSFKVLVLSGKSIIPNYDFEDYKVIRHKQPLTLKCDFNLDGAKSNLVLKWLKNDNPIDTHNEDRIQVISGENILNITKATDADAGNYTCIISDPKANITASDLKAVFRVVSKPIIKLKPHYSFIEGEKLQIPCSVIGTPTPDVYWIVGNVTYNETLGRIKLLSNPDNPVPKTLLQIDVAEMSDRNTYTCIAMNIASKIANSTEQETFVRVKDKLAALWPFLGICAEVIILCTIILIYEKKRNKTELDESDTDGSPEQKNTPDHGKESEVRQRK